MLRSVWIWAAGSVLTISYAAKVLLHSLFRGRGALCDACSAAGRAWSRAVLKLAGVDVRIEGSEHLAVSGPFIIVANHESWFDVWALAGCLPIDARFVAKKELERVPLFGRAWRACGHISIDRSDRASAIESMQRAGRQIQEEGLHMVIFAEGTRSPDGRLHPFKKGPFVLAIEGAVPIIPVGLTGGRPIMPKGGFRIRRGRIIVRIGARIPARGMVHADRDRLGKAVWKAVAELRGGQGRTSRLPGEPALDDVPGQRSSNLRAF